MSHLQVDHYEVRHNNNSIANGMVYLAKRRWSTWRWLI